MAHRRRGRRTRRWMPRVNLGLLSSYHSAEIEACCNATGSPRGPPAQKGDGVRDRLQVDSSVEGQCDTGRAAWLLRRHASFAIWSHLRQTAARSQPRPAACRTYIPRTASWHKHLGAFAPRKMTSRPLSPRDFPPDAVRLIARKRHGKDEPELTEMGDALRRILVECIANANVT